VGEESSSNKGYPTVAFSAVAAGLAGPSGVSAPDVPPPALATDAIDVESLGAEVLPVERSVCLRVCSP